MAGGTIKVEGLRELGQTFKTLSYDIQKKVARAATNAGAQIIKRSAQSKVPVDTGNLKKNIIVKRILPAEASPLTSQSIVTVRQGKLTEKQKGSGLEDAFYGRFVEFGTVKMSPRPYLRPAFEQNKVAAIDAMKSRLKDRIDKAQKGGK